MVLLKKLERIFFYSNYILQKKKTAIQMSGEIYKEKKPCEGVGL